MASIHSLNVWVKVSNVMFLVSFYVLFFYQVTSLEKKVAELESEIVLNSDVKARLKQENTQLVHR